MTPPTDREFDALIKRLDKQDEALARIQLTLAEQRGWLAAARWMGLGSLAGAAALVWQAVKAVAPGGLPPVIHH